jgi:hypothetical protein
MAMWRGTVLMLTDINAVVTVGSCERKANVANRLEYRSMNRFCGAFRKMPMASDTDALVYWRWRRIGLLE